MFFKKFLDKKNEVDRRPRTPGSLTVHDIEELQSGFAVRAKMARTPITVPIDLEPLPPRKTDAPHSTPKKK